MGSHGGELHALALSLVSDATPHHDAVRQLVDAAEHDQLRLLNACAWAEATLRSFPLDLNAQEALHVLQDAVGMIEHQPQAKREGPLAAVWRDADHFGDDLFDDLERLRTHAGGDERSRRR